MNYLDELSKIKPELHEDGFEIIGLFGSAARNELQENSDIDILYDLDTSFLNKHRGFDAISRLVEIKDFLSQKFFRQVDIVDIKNLSKTAQKYIMKDIKYV